MQVLVVLVMAVLPLRGVTMAVSSIEAPAHYHLPLQPTAAIPLVAETSHPHSHPAPVDHDHDHSHDLEILDIHPPAVDGHGGHDDDAREASERLATLESGDHHTLNAATHHHDAGMGHHGHALEQADVVYVADDADRSVPGAAGTHSTTSVDAALPARVPPIPAIDGTLLLPEGIRLFASRESEPALRPPSARQFHLA